MFSYGKIIAILVVLSLLGGSAWLNYQLTKEIGAKDLVISQAEEDKNKIVKELTDRHQEELGRVIKISQDVTTLNQQLVENEKEDDKFQVEFMRKLDEISKKTRETNEGIRRYADSVSGDTANCYNAPIDPLLIPSLQPVPQGTNPH